ncbi:DUF3782 domain-containing protein [Thermoflexus sp.]|uniref:DUF3782 domain-containing protein n=1 Tax=Thermoflexus sp. TaxID=1969742 RepID=UPI0026166694|nr:DUF3782 domain-containing protein [Thermoflexus sp.]MCX7691577.1 DUF3782 domain-containing protein [Thermoflexus sp.]
MSITLKDLPTLLKLLEQHPEWREALRALLLSEDLLRMPQELEAFRAEVYRRFAELAEALTRSVEMEIRQTQAQAHTEEALARLAEAQGRAEEHLARLEEVVAQLTERAVRLEEAMAQLAEQVVRLEEGQQRLEARLTRMEERLIRRLNAFGARWGSRSERAWREGMRAVLEAAGFEVERWVAFDAQGEVFDYPSDVELDVVIQDGRTLIVELRTSVSRDALPTMERKVKFYERQTGRKAHRRILMTPWYEPGVEEMARQLGWEIYGEPEEIEAEG